MSRRLKRTPKLKKLGQQAAQLAQAHAQAQEKLAAQEKRNRIVCGTIAARLGIIACELDLLVAACGGDIPEQSRAWLEGQALFFHGVADGWRSRASGTQWALAGVTGDVR